MSLANVLAVAQAAGKHIVLLGDPQHSSSRRKTHPDGVNVSALQHILGEHQTIPADRGIFLPVAAPRDVCEFTSEVFYERRLTSKLAWKSSNMAAHSSGAACGSSRWTMMAIATL